ncbi:MAG: IclR family transcriptional regulator [Marinobacter sp.]|uniref:IclR family transcriptional regulator n=1 Tax=Marinobacter sp. TaxID=50741 RepID=UPI0034A08D97
MSSIEKSNTSDKRSADEPTKSKKDGTRLSSVAAAIRLLKVFNEENAELGISTLSRQLKASKSTVHRLASTLLAEGLLEQDPVTERYRLGLGLFSLGALVRQRLSVTSVAKDLLTDLRDEVRENVELAVLKGHAITYIYDFESPEAVRLRPRLGLSTLAVDSALGMVMIAFQSEENIKDILNGADPRLSAARRKELYKEIEQIRLEGFAAEEENAKMGAICVSAPIRNANGSVTSAIGVTVPDQRVDADRMKLLARRVVETAHAISLRLGYIQEQADLHT